VKLADVVGHDAAVARLRRAAAEGRPASAYLLLGPAGIGKRTLADAFAARLLCERPAGDDACGTCRHCTRLAAGTHPDLHVVVREEDRRDIRIEQARELTRWLSMRPLMAERKVAIIDGAECLNEHGQNALLKTLEEPPGQAVLLLTAAAPGLVLPTVRSRCQLVHLRALAAGDVTTVLVRRGVEPATADMLAAQAEGSPGRALVLADDQQARPRTALLDALPELGSLAAAELSALAQGLRGGAEAALGAAVGWYRDVLGTALGVDAVPRRNPQRADAIRAAAGRHSPAQVLRQLAVVCDTLDALGRNANQQLALETMLLGLRDVERAG
jgi:DNA polymerase-3 subunit delta'